MTARSPAPPLPENLPELTSLRFFAAAMVVAFHYTEVFWTSAELQLTGLLGRAYLGVDFFFILSGFILTHVYLRSYAEKRFNYVDFIWARLARIYPVHLFTTLFLLGVLVTVWQLGFYEHAPTYLRAVLANLTLTHAWGTLGHWSLNEPSWSISAEWGAYLLFPAFLALTTVLRRWPFVFLAGAIGFVLVAWPISFALFSKDYTHLAYDFGVLRILPTFVLGCAVYTVAASTALDRKPAQILLAAAILATLAAMHFFAHQLVIILAFGLLVYAAAQIGRHRDASAKLDHPFMIYLGEISFSLYMVHRVVEHTLIELISRLTGWEKGPDMALAAAVLSILAAAAVYQWIETPARKLMRANPPSSWLARKRSA
jgi:peptidoglycan/LPS O-acetylase OafA/YrhL